MSILDVSTAAVTTAAPRPEGAERSNRSGGRAEVRRAGQSTSLFVGVNFPAARIGAAHLCPLIGGKPCIIIRRPGWIQPEHIGRNLREGRRGG